MLNTFTLVTINNKPIKKVYNIFVRKYQRNDGYNLQIKINNVHKNVMSINKTIIIY